MPLCEACPPGRYPPPAAPPPDLLSFFRNPDLLHRLMGELLWNFHPGIPTDDPPLFKNLVFADGIVRFADGEPTEEAKAIFAFIPKLRRTFLSAPTASPSTAGTIGERTTPPSAKPMWRKIDPMKNRMLQSKPWIALPLFLGALSFLCSLLLQCQPCALLLHRLHPCRACLLLERDDFFLPGKAGRHILPYGSAG